MCSPAAYKSTYVQKGRCLSDADLRVLAKEVYSADLPSPNRELASALASTLGSSDMSRWAEAAAVRQNPKLRRLLQARFRPQRPRSWAKNPRMWLSTDDIRRVMQQYETSHPHFRFLGVFPRDFSEAKSSDSSAAASDSPGKCIAGASVCHLDPKALTGKGYRCAGAVFNMDRHDQRGSHWVACFVGTDPRRRMYGIYYYDSVARPPPPEIAKWILQARDRQVASLVSSKRSARRHFEVRYNKVRRQFMNTECGIFSMHFLTRALESDIAFDELCQTMGYDDDMYALRGTLYRP